MDVKVEFICLFVKIVCPNVD